MTLTTYPEALRGELPFWDEAGAGEQCAVPCWPCDANGNAIDCPGQTLLVGVLGEDGLFRAEEEPTFDPAQYGYICAGCSPTRVGIVHGPADTNAVPA